MTSQEEGSAPIEIESWLNSKASWLRAAAHDLITHRRMPDEAGIDALADQPDETPTHLPDPDEIIADATALRTWIDDFDKRAKSAAEGKAAA